MANFAFCWLCDVAPMSINEAGLGGFSYVNAHWAMVYGLKRITSFIDGLLIACLRVVLGRVHFWHLLWRDQMSPGCTFGVFIGISVVKRAVLGLFLKKFRCSLRLGGSVSFGLKK